MFVVGEECNLDIVRELSFISIDGGNSWRAEVIKSDIYLLFLLC